MDNIKLIILLIASLAWSSAFADATTCTMAGEWQSSVATYYWEFSQEGTEVNAKTDSTNEQYCGKNIITGTNIDGNVELTVKTENTDIPVCASGIGTISLKFSDDCTKAYGTYTKQSDHDAPYQGNITFWRSEVWLDSDYRDYAISADGEMPKIKVTARLPGYTAMEVPPYIWSTNLTFSNPFHEFAYKLDDVTTTISEYEPNINNLIPKSDPERNRSSVLGGYLTISVKYYDSTTAHATYKILGTNPGKDRIEAVLTDKTSRQIACLESRYKQFNADREGGVGPPNFGGDNKTGKSSAAGIMQIIGSTPALIWDWKANLQSGLALLEAKRKNAKTRYIRERDAINKTRSKKLGPCSTDFPAKFTPEQLEREAIREYNGGLEYAWIIHDEKTCAGEWIIQPRRLVKGTAADYTNRVLNCSLKN